MRYVLLLVLVLLTVSLSESATNADILLQDDFNDNSLDPTKWTTVLPNIPGTPGVAEQNQHIELADRGYLVTASQFDPSVVGSLTLTGTWTFNSSQIDFQQEDVMDIFTRADAIPDGPPYGEVQNGVGFNLHMDGPSSPGKMWINYRIGGSGFVLLAEAPIQIHNGDSFQFTIRDDGLNVMFSVQQVGGPASGMLSASVPNHFATNRIVFYNGQRGINSAPHLSYLDNVTLTGVVPEPSSIVLLGCGLLACTLSRLQHGRSKRRI